MWFLHFLLFVKVDVQLKIRCRDVIQIENIGTSTFLAIGPKKHENSTKILDIFTTNKQDNAEFYWIVKSTQDQLKKIKCNSIISIMDAKDLNYISVYFFFENNYPTISKEPGGAQCLWNITCENDDDQNWYKGRPVQFKNLEHNCYLSTSLDNPSNTFFPNRWGLNCISESQKNSFWKAEKGLSFLKKEHLS